MGEDIGLWIKDVKLAPATYKPGYRFCGICPGGVLCQIDYFENKETKTVLVTEVYCPQCVFFHPDAYANMLINKFGFAVYVSLLDYKLK